RLLCLPSVQPAHAVDLRSKPGTVGPMTNGTNRRFELEDVNGQPLRFDGELLAQVTSQRADRPKPRWMEMRIFRTAGGNYVLEIIGQTSIEGEAIKARAKVLATATELIDAL